MFEANLVVKNPTGLHARPATDLVLLCQRYRSQITIHKGDVEINAKSIISVLAGGVSQGTAIRLLVRGSDEEEAGKAVVELIESFAE